MAKDSIWNEGLVNKLKDLYLKKEMTTVNIAKELGFTKNAIIGKIHRLNLNTLKEIKTINSKEKTLAKKEDTKIIKSPKEKTIVTLSSDEIKSVINIAKKSNTVIAKTDIPFIVEEISKVQSDNNNLINKSIPSFMNEHIDKNQNLSHKNNSKKQGKYKLSEIESNMCVWPFGEDEFSFCGDKVVAGKSYCQSHLDLVYFVTKKAPKKKYAEVGEEDIEGYDEEESEKIN